MKNALFVCDRHTLDDIKICVSRTKQFDIKKSLFITSQQEYKDYLAELKNDQGKGKKGVKSAKEKQRFTYIYISVDLAWGEDNQLFEGYKVGFDLIEKMNLSKLSICFYGVLPRKVIFNHIDVKYKFLVKALPFEYTVCIRDFYKFPTQLISESKLRFFMHYAFTQFGILDHFAHRLDSANESEKIKKIFTEILSYKEFIGEDICNYLENVKKYTTDDKVEVAQMLRNRVAMLKGQVIKPKPKEFVSQYKILVIEDDKKYQDIIKTSLLRYYNNNRETLNQNVVFHSSGVEALNLLQEKDKKNKNKYIENFDFILTDLELLDDDGFYQPNVQGVDIFEFAKKLTKTVVGVITGYGIKGIEELLDISSKHIVYKKHLEIFSDKEIDRLMLNLLAEYTRKEQGNFSAKQGPIFGIIANPGYKTELARLCNEDEAKYHTEAWNQAKCLAEKFIDGTLHKHNPIWNYGKLASNSTDKTFDITKFIEEKHPIILAHRLMVLYHYIANNYCYDEEDFGEKMRALTNLTLFDKKYLTSTLGFSRAKYTASDCRTVNNGKISGGKYDGKKNEELHQIKFKNLYTEEREWIKMWEERCSKTSAQMPLKDNAEEIVNTLKDKVGKIFSDENFDNFTFSDLTNFLRDTFPKKFNELKTQKNTEDATEIINLIECFLSSRKFLSYFTELEKQQINEIIDDSLNSLELDE